MASRQFGELGIEDWESNVNDFLDDFNNNACFASAARNYSSQLLLLEQRRFHDVVHLLEFVWLTRTASVLRDLWVGVNFTPRLCRTRDPL